jgi:hypothetical protein
MTGSSTGGRSLDVAGKSILNRAHHTMDSSIPRSLLRIGPSWGMATIRYKMGHLVILNRQALCRRRRTEVLQMPSRLAISDFESFSLRESRLISAVFLAADLGLPKVVPLARAWAMPGGRSPGSISATSARMRSTMLSLRSSTPTTISRFHGSGYRVNTPQPTEPAGTCTSRTFSPNTTSATAVMAASATIMSQITTSRSSATSSLAVSGRRSTSSTGCSRTKATSSPTFFMPTHKANQSRSSRSRKFLARLLFTALLTTLPPEAASIKQSMVRLDWRDCLIEGYQRRRL